MNNQSDRRHFLKQAVRGTLAAGATAAILSHPALSTAATPENVSTPVDPKPVTTEAEFRYGVIGPAELSLATCEIAVEKAQYKYAKEFANFELGEAIAVTTVLKDLGTPVPPMDEKAKAILEKLKSTPAGPEFDKAYIAAQLENHIFLRKHATDYLTHAPKEKGSSAEQQGRHLATLTAPVFQEHVDLTTRILDELKG